jgi:hypothetical protein
MNAQLKWGDIFGSQMTKNDRKYHPERELEHSTQRRGIRRGQKIDHTNAKKTEEPSSPGFLYVLF